MIPNEELWERTGQEQIITEIKKRKWAWIGHTLRKPAKNTTRQALSWNPQGKRKVGRLRQTWRRSVEEELKAIGMKWSELGRTCQNRVRWRSVVTDLCSPRNQEAYIKKRKPQDVVQNNSNETSQSFTTVGWRCAALAGVVVKLGRVCAQVQLIHGVVGAQVGAVGVGHRIVPVGLKLRRAVGDGVT